MLVVGLVFVINSCIEEFLRTQAGIAPLISRSGVTDGFDWFIIRNNTISVFCSFRECYGFKTLASGKSILADARNSVRDLQFFQVFASGKTFAPIVFTVSGIFSDVRLLQFWNVPSLIAVTVAGSSTLSRLLQS